MRTIKIYKPCRRVKYKNIRMKLGNIIHQMRFHDYVRNKIVVDKKYLEESLTTLCAPSLLETMEECYC